jgi:hypothetical protein
MDKIKGLTINYAKYNLANGKEGKIAVFIYTGEGDPTRVLDAAVREYVQDFGYNELIDANLDNPWMRVVISDINEMKQEIFDPATHRINN